VIGAEPVTHAVEFGLPPELVAQRPLACRDRCRLLCVQRDAPGALAERRFDTFDELLQPGDLLVRNVSRVLPARLLGQRPGGGAAEILLLEPATDGAWWALVRPGRKLLPGARVRLAPDVEIEIRAAEAGGRRLVAAAGGADLAAVAERLGRMPLPPYVRRAADAADRDDYQTVYARVPGSVAAPTAGLHFTPALLQRIAARGVRVADLVLHVGLGTFAPMRSADPRAHVMHWERFEIEPALLYQVEATRARGGRIVAVGTTVVRALESWHRVQAGAAGDDVVLESTPAGGVRGRTRLFLHPPDAIRSIDALVTNFHLPHSTLLLLVAAFAGTAATQAAYAHAIAARFRFYSYGDAMWIA
jgi:S-adenosylmethionine:tRNA ribosyltransferase-isomerase